MPDWYSYTHGVAQFVAWGIFAPLVVWASSSRGRNKSWFTQHWVLGLLTNASSLFGVSLLFYKYGAFINFNTYFHHWLGALVLFLAVLQSLLGLVIHLQYRPERIATPFLDKVHWYIGRSLFFSSWYQMWGGVSILTASNSAPAAQLVPTAFVLYGFFVMSALFWPENASAPKAYSPLGGLNTE